MRSSISHIFGGLESASTYVHRRADGWSFQNIALTDLADKIVLLSAGWSDEVFGQERYYEEGPYLSEDAARTLAAAGPRAIGADFPVDSHGTGIEQAAWACHRTSYRPGSR